MLEGPYKTHLIKRIRNEVLPGSIVLKNDANYMQGIPDISVFYWDRYGMLEVKTSPPAPSDFEPNQKWYISLFAGWAFGACIYPENEEEVLRELQSALQSDGQARLPVPEFVPLDPILRREAGRPRDIQRRRTSRNRASSASA